MHVTVRIVKNPTKIRITEPHHAIIKPGDKGLIIGMFEEDFKCITDIAEVVKDLKKK